KGWISSGFNFGNDGFDNDLMGSYGYNWMGTASSGAPRLGRPWPRQEYLLGLGFAHGLPDPVPADLPPIAEASVRNPTEMFAIGEPGLSPGYPGHPAESIMNFGVDSSLYPLRHGKNYNQLCCDGHVEALRPAKLFLSAETATRWNNDNQPHPETWPLRLLTTS